MQQNQLHRDFVNRTAKERYSIMYGSKASGKTIERLINYFILAKCIPNAKIQVIAESMPVIKSGCLADFRYMFAPYFKRYGVKENATDKMFFFPNNSTLQFMQVDDKDKANQLGRATFRFINEANNIDKETFDLLDIRTERQISLDYNPTSKFWVDEISTEKNTGKFNWYQNPFLSEAQYKQFQLWTEIGKQSKVGSPNYYRWQVYCEGNYCELAGEIISVDNLRFRSELPPLNYLIAFADPSNARGGDYFAVCLCGLDTAGDVWLVDSFSSNNASKAAMYDKLKEWQQKYGCQIFIETNGEIGNKFFRDCQLSGLSVRSWWSSANKFDRIFANLDIFTHKLWVYDTPSNGDFCAQFYQFSQKNKDGDGHDDNIDCLNNCFLYYIDQRKLKTLFV
ncbi:MAG: phage terminase large subunit [Bacteroidales bacterium]|nr:phage terminase large subunit [Bacteroidales bacterium]MBQ4009242.1 phage terminase large subunit [Bacteroidales bacterium]